MTQNKEISNLTLILGGTRSGKSAWGENLLTRKTEKNRERYYLATAELREGDKEMAERVRLHRSRRRERGENWKVVEESLLLAQTVAGRIPSQAPLLIDGLTLWLARMQEENAVPPIEPKVEELLSVLAAREGVSILISDEVGQGIIASNPVVRDFADMCGLMNQRIAARAGRVVLVTAGLPQQLKPGG
ncbi:MAG: bifunctional adenosylcobinamide kinase/adenosylcobinamide-phosphate guanylyltransferase [Alphaproteobacteria bacterium]